MNGTDFTGWMLFLSPHHQRQTTEGKVIIGVHQKPYLDLIQNQIRIHTELLPQPSRTSRRGY